MATESLTYAQIAERLGINAEAARGPGTKLLRYQRMVADARFPTTGSSQVPPCRPDRSSMLAEAAARLDQIAYSLTPNAE